MIVTGVPATVVVVETTGGVRAGVVFVTTTAVAGETAALLFASAGVVAVIVAVPTGSEGTVNVATPFTIVAVPKSVGPL